MSPSHKALCQLSAVLPCQPCLCNACRPCQPFFVLVSNTSLLSKGLCSSAENPKNDRNGPIDEAAGSANSYLALAALNAAAALPLAVAPHTVADFLFGDAALPHDFLHEPLLRILATGFAGASTAAASLNVSKQGNLMGALLLLRLSV